MGDGPWIAAGANNVGMDEIQLLKIPKSQTTNCISMQLNKKGTLPASGPYASVLGRARNGSSRRQACSGSHEDKIQWLPSGE
jgi:hypothetical protein